MVRKTKPIYLLIAGLLLLLVAIIFVFLLFQACNTTSPIVEVSSSDQAKPKYHNEYHSTVDSVSPTEKVAISDTATDNVIRAKGLCADKKGNVYDANGNKYKSTDGYIAIVYEGNIYKISAKYIREKNPTDKKEEAETKATTTPTEKEKNTTQQNYPANNSSTNRNPQVSSGVSVSQNGNVSKETTAQPATENIKMSYSALTVNCDTVFSLTLVGAEGDVVWGFENTCVEVVRPYGNHCNFNACKKGTVRVVAVYKGNRYYCTVTIN